MLSTNHFLINLIGPSLYATIQGTLLFYTIWWRLLAFARDESAMKSQPLVIVTPELESTMINRQDCIARQYDS